MRPQPAHPREVVLELGQLDLQLALRARRVAGKDVEDHCGSVDHWQAELAFERALLTRGQLVIAGDQVRVELGREPPQLDELARPKIALRVRALAMLHEPADDGDARRAQQLTELGEILLLRRGGDANRALAGAAAARQRPGSALRGATVTRALHAAIAARAPAGRLSLA